MTVGNEECDMGSENGKALDAHLHAQLTLDGHAIHQLILRLVRM